MAMRFRGMLALGLWAAAAVSASAQSAETPPPPVVSGYAVGGPAGYSAFFGSRRGLWSAAGGVDIVSGAGVGVGSAVTPFVSAGYTRLLGLESAFDGWNIGGGFTWWSSVWSDIRPEVRDHIRADRERWAHYWTIRAGLAFR
jgi:hypothetical protein